MSVSVWADTNSATYSNIGQGKMCLSHIAAHKTKYEDLTFDDPITKETVQYPARVYTGTMRLNSAFWGNSCNTV